MIAQNKQYDGSIPLKSVMQEMFVSNILAGLSQTDAYKAAYKSCKNTKSANEASSRLLSSNINVIKRLEHKRANIERESDIKIGYCRYELLRLAKVAEEKGQINTAKSCFDSLLRSIGGMTGDKPHPDTIKAKQRTEQHLERVRKIVTNEYHKRYLATEQSINVIDVGLEGKD